MVHGQLSLVSFQCHKLVVSPCSSTPTPGLASPNWSFAHSKIPKKSTRSRIDWDREPLPNFLFNVSATFQPFSGQHENISSWFYIKMPPVRIQHLIPLIRIEQSCLLCTPFHANQSIQVLPWTGKRKSQTFCAAGLKFQHGTKTEGKAFLPLLLL